MDKLDMYAELNELRDHAVDIVKQAGFDPTEDEFKIIQPYDDHNVIMISAVEEDGKRTIKIDVNDGLIILPAKAGTLDIFQDTD